ncbi:enolase C-terminal domain-like protein [Candidatus Latescibacterota bacterium]
MDRREFLTKTGLGAASTPFWWGIMPEDAAADLPPGIKITDIKSWIVHTRGTNRVFVKLYTNEGITGLGEGLLYHKEHTLKASIDEHRELLIGQNPTRIEYLWQAMYRWPRWRGVGPVMNASLSAIDIALWDIMGKLLDVPIYKLLGGACRDKVRTYRWIGGSSPEQRANQVSQAKAEGYTCIKCHPKSFGGEMTSKPWDFKLAVEIMRAMREAAGDDFDVAIDAHGFLSPLESLEYARAVEEYRPFYLEEPVQSEDMETFKWLSDRVAIPLCNGERMYTKWGFRDMIANRLVSYVQPDVSMAGGISEVKRISAMAEASSIDVANHNCSSLVCALATLHLGASTANTVICELLAHSSDSAEADLFYGAGTEFIDGYVSLPTAPGLGCDLDEKVADSRPYQPGRRQNSLSLPDGSIWDL